MIADSRARMLRLPVSGKTFSSAKSLVTTDTSRSYPLFANVLDKVHLLMENSQWPTGLFQTAVVCSSLISL